MTPWLALLSIVLAALVAHHMWESRRGKRWESKIDGVITGFKALEHIVSGAISQRTGIEVDIEDLKKRMKKLEDWKRMGDGL